MRPSYLIMFKEDSLYKLIWLELYDELLSLFITLIYPQVENIFNLRYVKQSPETFDIYVVLSDFGPTLPLNILAASRVRPGDGTALFSLVTSSIKLAFRILDQLHLKIKMNMRYISCYYHLFATWRFLTWTWFCNMDHTILIYER